MLYIFEMNQKQSIEIIKSNLMQRRIFFIDVYLKLFLANLLNCISIVNEHHFIGSVLSYLAWTKFRIGCLVVLNGT